MHEAFLAAGWERRLGMGAEELDLGFGAAIVTADLPQVFDQNVVLVRESVDPQRLIDAIERVAAQAGWRHRTIEVFDESLAAQLRPDMRAAGYAENSHLTMALSDDHPPPADDTAAAVVAVAQQQELARALLSAEPWATTDDILDQFAERERRLAAVADGQAVVAPADAPVSRCLLLRDGGFFEIDAVGTLPQHQGKGWSTAVMARAIRVGLATAMPVVLVADAGDWPRHWYERLGFDVQGVVTEFRRWPDKG